MERRRRTASEIVLGALGGVMILAAVVLLFVGGEADGAAAGVTGPVPDLRLLEPRPRSGVGTRMEVVFESDDEIGPMAGGWGTGTLHLHLRLDGTELMPGPTDIRRDGDRYRWTVGPLKPGDHTLRLLWSGPDHAPLAEGSSRAVKVTAR